ncbi:MAG: hypothetical protein P4K92_00595 [Candidatus Nitrosotalea sp.]|nr:hypothetical protein [Candidatus Nitrosotalea sp.]
MGHLKITPELRSVLGETYCKEFCVQNGWAYASLEQIYKDRIHKNKLEFKHGFERIRVKIPSEIQKEITVIAKYSNKKEENPSFVYDFLACKTYENKDPRNLADMKPEDFRWIEIKTGYGKLGRNQFDTSKKIKISLFRCRVTNILAPPEEVKVFWDEVNESCLR